MSKPKSALILCDYQVAMGPMLGPTFDTVLDRASVALEAARARGDILIVHVGVRFRPGHPEISTDPHKAANFRHVKEKNMVVEGSPEAAHHPKVSPKAGEVEVTKRRVGAFSTTDLDLILRGNNVSRIILAGISTSGVILTTVREAADKDYLITVLRDTVADKDEEMHRVLLDKVFPKQATVITVDEFVASLDS